MLLYSPDCVLYLLDMIFVQFCIIHSLSCIFLRLVDVRELLYKVDTNGRNKQHMLVGKYDCDGVTEAAGIIVKELQCRR